MGESRVGARARESLLSDGRRVAGASIPCSWRERAPFLVRHALSAASAPGLPRAARALCWLGWEESRGKRASIVGGSGARYGRPEHRPR